MYDLVTIGSATRDIVIRTRAGKLVATPDDPLAQKVLAFEYGAKIPVLQTYDNFGGGGCNVAIGLARLGLNVAARVNLGKDLEGFRIKKRLNKEKVATRLLTWDRKEKTDISVVVVDEKVAGDHIIFVDKNASNNLVLGKRKLAARWVYVSSLGGQWEKLLSDLLKAASADKTKIVFNPGSLQLAAGYEGLRNIFARLEILIVSLDEAVELVLGKNKGASLSPEGLAKELFSWGPKVVVITQGARGALAYDGKNLKQRPAVKVKKVVDTTGAGDAFSAGFVGAMVLGGDLDRALEWGAKNSASVIQKYGAQVRLLKRAELEF